MISYQLTPSHRVVVDYDTDAQLYNSPDNRYDTLFYEVASCNNLDIHEGAQDVINALDHVEEAVNSYAYTGPRAVSRALIKHLGRHGYKAVYRTLPGQCPSDWIDCVIAVHNESGVDLDGAVRDWERWYNGDYYTLLLQRRHVWHDAAGDTLETWDDVDALSGVEFDDVYDGDEVYRVAREYFDVKEAA